MKLLANKVQVHQPVQVPTFKSILQKIHCHKILLKNLLLNIHKQKLQYLYELKWGKWFIFFMCVHVSLVWIHGLQFKDNYYFLFYCLLLSLHRKCITNFIYKFGWCSITSDFSNRRKLCKMEPIKSNSTSYIDLHLSFT